LYPEFFSLGPITVHSFGVMMALAFISAGLMTAWGMKRRGLDPEFAYSMLIAAMVGGVVGAKIHYLMVHPDQFGSAAFSGSGLIWYGGLIGGTLAVLLVVVLTKRPVALIADAIGPALALSYAVGRVGCLLRGDDYGVPTDLPWGMSFPQGLPPTDQTVHPTQIYEIVMSLVILAVLLWVLQPRLRRAGSLFWSYVALAGVERFLVEFIRTNEPVALGLTQAQWISVAFFISGVTMVSWLETHVASGIPSAGYPAVAPKGGGKRPSVSAAPAGGSRTKTRSNKGGARKRRRA
jgi:phosphatidylglycerol:prolipoprotein diacylglycerol transferase